MNQDEFESLSIFEQAAITPIFQQGFQAGASSLDAEVAVLNQEIERKMSAATFVLTENDQLRAEVAELNRRLNQPVILSEWQMIEQERDQLREQVAVLREALKDAYPWEIHFQENCDCSFCEALYATEPKP